MSSLYTPLLFAIVGASLGAACSGQEAPKPQPTAAPAPSAPVQTAVAAAPLTAENVFASRCATCHGQSGQGDGPAAAALNPKPRNYSDAEWQKSVTDEQLKKAIVGGGVAVGKSPLMTPNPDLEANNEVLEGLVKIIRSFAPKT